MGSNEKLELDYRKCDRLSIRYDGQMRDAMGRVIHCYTDLQTRSSFMVFAEDDPAERLAEVRARFEKKENTNG